MGRIDLSKQFDAVVLVLLNENFDATAIYEATRKAVSDALHAPGSRSRNERGALGVSKFKAIGRRVWPASVAVEQAAEAAGRVPRRAGGRARHESW
jgi:hypothetical protein